MLSVDVNHYDVLPFHDVRCRLFDGYDQMHKVINIDELEKWLSKNKLPGYKDQEQLGTKVRS